MGSLQTETINNVPHLLCIPFPAQGHVNPFMQLAKLFHSHGFFITFVYTEFNHRRLLRSKGPTAVQDFPRFRFKTIPDGVPPSNPNATQSVMELLYYTQKHSVQPLRYLITRLNSANDGFPPVSCVMSDGIMCFAIKVARELGIPEVQFWTASTCGFMAYLQFPHFVDKGIFPIKDESYIRNKSFMETRLEWIPGMSHMRFKDMPSFVRSTNPNDISFNRWLEEAQDNLKSDGIIFNTFYDFESEVLDVVSSTFSKPNNPIFSVGPLNLLVETKLTSQNDTVMPNLWKNDTHCLTWLDQRKPNSVVYVNFGSIAKMTNDNLNEFARGLADSGHPFLWILRSDVVMGESAILSEEFLEETKERGLIVEWCPQDKILNHASIGAFLTHSGWNSTLEGICGGKPMICWPYFAEQQVNCKYACSAWGVGLEIDLDVKREQVATHVREMMEGERGKVMREKALEWKNKSYLATAKGGSSYNEFHRLVEYLTKLSSLNA